jgi:tRNA pseudouridine38-40 synthase
MNVKLVIEYDGTHYSGWQSQPNGVTIQALLEKALETYLGVKTKLYGSGRTDAGVHALGQAANFLYDGAIEPMRLLAGLNALTPDDIVIRAVERVADGFDARRDAKSRLYEYRIWNRPWPSAFQRRFSWHVPVELDTPAMEDAAAVLVGEHDFASFQATGCDAHHSLRTIFRSVVAVENEFVTYTIEANAYLRHMVRNIVGTLVEIGRGTREAQSMGELLEARERPLAGPTAPAHGLFLVSVNY